MVGCASASVSIAGVGVVAPKDIHPPKSLDNRISSLVDPGGSRGPSSINCVKDDFVIGLVDDEADDIGARVSLSAHNK